MILLYHMLPCDNMTGFSQVLLPDHSDIHSLVRTHLRFLSHSTQHICLLLGCFAMFYNIAYENFIIYNM